MAVTGAAAALPTVDNGSPRPPAAPPAALHLSLPAQLTEPDPAGQIPAAAVGPAPHAPTTRNASREPRVGSASASPVGARETPATDPAAGSGLAYNSLIHKSSRLNSSALAAWALGDQLTLTGFGAMPGRAERHRAAQTQDRPTLAINGVVVERKVSVGGTDRAGLTVGWLTGRERRGERTTRSGSAWSLAGSAALLTGRLRLNAEYAGSQLQADRAAGEDDNDAENANAYRASVELLAKRDASLDWRLGSEYRAVAPNFGSLGNPTLAADRSDLRTFAGLSHGQWQWDLTWHRQRDNLEDAPSAPVRLKDKWQLAAAWAGDGAAPAGRFGRPSFRFTVDAARDWQLYSRSATSMATQRSIKLLLQGEFAHPNWHWGIHAKGALTPGKIDAPTGRGVETLMLKLFGALPDDGMPPIRPSVSWQQRRDSVTGTRAQHWRASARTDGLELHDDLAADLDLAYQRRLRFDGRASDRSASLGASLRWTLQRPSHRRSGLALSLSGRVQSIDTTATGGASGDYRLMLSVSSVAAHPKR